MSLEFDMLISFVLIVLVWLGLWGLVESIISLFVPAENYCNRIVIYLLIFIVATAILLTVAKSLIRVILNETRNLESNGS